MRIFGQQLHSVTESHLTEMLNVANENTVLEFKEAMYGGSDADKREFAKDISGLANAAGGHLVIGIATDRDGVAEKITPVMGFNPDKDVLRLTSILRDGIEPRLTGIDFGAVPVAGGHVLIFEVPASWNPPHRVNMRSNQFYLRHPRSTDPMSVEEIRSLVLRTVDREQAAREFRDRRVQQLAGNPAVLTGDRDCIFALHIVPMSNSRPALDLRRAMASKRFFPPLDVNLVVHPNFDGLGRNNETGRPPSRIQVYRNGTIEAVIHECLEPGHDDQPGRVHLGFIQKLLFEQMPSYVEGLENVDFDPPYAIFITVIGATQRGLLTEAHYDAGRDHRAALEVLPCEPVLLESASLDDTDPQAPWRQALRPALDQLWQAFGYERCYSFNEDGGWNVARTRR